ncbi:MAG: hypothetical protein GX625_14605 [Clostridiaceae bacterium]|nr:hypothetical protein [Clostridiaceae bacterium]
MLALFVSLGGGLAGFGSLYLHYRQYKKQIPIISGFWQSGYYEIEKSEPYDKIVINSTFVINNSSNSPTSISHGMAIIRIHPDAVKHCGYDAVRGNIISNQLPKDVKASGTTKLDFTFSVNTSMIEGLDRCMIPIDPKVMYGLKNHEYIEEPLAVHFYFKYTHGQFDTKACIFRNDQDRSSRIRGEQGILAFSKATALKDDQEVKIFE